MPGTQYVDLPMNCVEAGSPNGRSGFDDDHVDDFTRLVGRPARNSRNLGWPIFDGGRDDAVSGLGQVTKLRTTKVEADNPDSLIGVGPPSSLVNHYPSSSEGDSSATTDSSGRHSPQTSLSELCRELRPHHTPSLPPHVDAQSQRLLDLTARTKYEIIQRNGQRIYGPPPDWDKEPPSKGSEIFVGRVPRDCFEDELVPVFEKIGMIYELRLMMDFSGSNRGFFFVRYTCVEDARRACRELDNFEIRPNKRLGVLLSVDNRKLWISGIPNNITAEEIKDEMLKMTSGVTDVILYRSQTDKSKTRKYAFIEYESHRAAALARRRLVPTKICLKGQEIEKVDWAEPEDEPDESTMACVKVLFVRNLTEAVTEDILLDKFNEWSEMAVERVKKTKDYAFVHFNSRHAAEIAKRRAMGEFLDGEPLAIEWSKPVDKNSYNMRKQLTKVLSNPSSMQYPGPISTVAPGVQPFLVRGIAPRKRGAAGILGLGAPGTPPPRNLLRRLGAVGQPVPGGAEPVPSPGVDKGPWGTTQLDPNILRAIYEMRLSQAGYYNGLPASQPVEFPHYGPHYPVGVPVAYAPPHYMAAVPPNIFYPKINLDQDSVNENPRA